MYLKFIWLLRGTDSKIKKLSDTDNFLAQYSKRYHYNSNGRCFRFLSTLNTTNWHVLFLMKYDKQPRHFSLCTPCLMLSSRKIRGRASVFAIDNPVQLHDFSWNKIINSNEQTQRISWQNFQNNLKCKLVIYLFAPNIFLREILFLNSFQAFRIFTFSPFASLLSM